MDDSEPLKRRRKKANVNEYPFLRKPPKPETGDKGIFASIRRKVGKKRKGSMTSLSSTGDVESQDNVDTGDTDGSSSREPQPPLNREEETYRAVLKSLLFPLGTPSGRKGYTPYELVDYVKSVFEFEDSQHERCLQAEEITGPVKSCLLHVRVIEGRELTPMDSNGLSDPYCLIGVVSEKAHKLAGSPSLKRKTSSRQQPLLDLGKCQTTKVERKTLEPKWNESFEIELKDYKNEALEIYVWDNDEEETLKDSVRQLDSAAGIKSILRTLKQTVEFGKPVDDLIGCVRIHLKDISATGTETWYDISLKNSNKPKTTGQIKLQLELKYPQISSIQDSAESDQHQRVLPVDQYYQFITKICEHTAKSENENCQEEGFSGKLSTQCEMTLEQFSVPNGISKISRALLKLIALLELTVDHTRPAVRDAAIRDAIVHIEMVWMTEQMRHGLGDTFMVSDWELSKFDEVSSKYVHRIIRDISDIPHLFPPVESNLEAFNTKVSLIVTLLNIHLLSSNPSSKKDLTTLIIERIKRDAKFWMEEKLKTIYSDDKDAVLPEIQQLTFLINEATTASTPNYTFTQFFSGRLGIDYYKVVTLALDSKISGKTKELMHELDRYLLRYHKFPENIMLSSKISMTIYIALRRMYYQFRENMSERDVFMLTMSKFYEWFMESLIFWLQTFRSEAIRRMEKALEIDKDVVVVTTLVKYSNSSVDVLSCFDKMITEWQDIDYVGADNYLMGITKICDTICDGARMYADKIRFILEKNGFYDQHHEQFDVTDQLCITLNNIEHVRGYLNELPQKLEWHKACMNMAIAHEKEELEISSFATLVNLVSDANKDMSMKSKTLIKRIIDKMSVGITKNIELFTIKEPNKRNSIDPLLQYLESNLGKLYERLTSSIFPKMLDEIWDTVLQILNSKLITGKNPEYYSQMKRRLDSLKLYFTQGGCEDDKLKTQEYKDLCDELKVNSKETGDLLLDYFENTALNVETPVEYYGHLAIKLAYVEETGANITLFVKVISANELPGLDTSGLSDPYIIVELCPAIKFPNHKQQKTRVISKTLNPVFNQTFQFNCVPKDYLTLKGAVVHFMAMDYDFIIKDDFAGETFVNMSSIKGIAQHETCDVVPAVMMPVKRPDSSHQIPCYEVLTQRAVWDKDARQFVNTRQVLFENQKQRTDIKDGDGVFSSGLCSNILAFFSNVIETARESWPPCFHDKQQEVDSEDESDLDKLSDLDLDLEGFTSRLSSRKSSARSITEIPSPHTWRKRSNTSITLSMFSSTSSSSRRSSMETITTKGSRNSLKKRNSNPWFPPGMNVEELTGKSEMYTQKYNIT